MAEVGGVLLVVWGGRRARGTSSTHVGVGAASLFWGEGGPRRLLGGDGPSCAPAPRAARCSYSGRSETVRRTVMMFSSRVLRVVL